MNTFLRLLAATGSLSLALNWAWVGMYVVWAIGRPASTIEPPASAVQPRDSRPEPKASTIDYRYVASSLGKVYHRADCFYASKQLKSEHAVYFDTPAQAEATGRHACTNCLSAARVASSARPPENQTTGSRWQLPPSSPSDDRPPTSPPGGPSVATTSKLER